MNEKTALGTRNHPLLNAILTIGNYVYFFFHFLFQIYSENNFKNVPLVHGYDFNNVPTGWICQCGKQVLQWYFFEYSYCLMLIKLISLLALGNTLETHAYKTNPPNKS
ncbi:uncharacterized protein LOC142236027 [Haematobia irritans]|uniref:uncharacterized protein LOC142236027 n=1 Tax=Haematobia irritans TaxID=7368 RepID=UPI003F4FB12A